MKIVFSQPEPNIIQLAELSAVPHEQFAEDINSDDLDSLIDALGNMSNDMDNMSFGLKASADIEQGDVAKLLNLLEYNGIIDYWDLEAEGDLWNHFKGDFY